MTYLQPSFAIGIFLKSEWIISNILDERRCTCLARSFSSDAAYLFARFGRWKLRYCLQFRPSQRSVRSASLMEDAASLPD